MTSTIELSPLGGLGRIGLNLMMMRTAGARLIIDCGMQFPDAKAPGVEFVLPDLGALREFRPDAYIITHGHEDHIGGLPHALRVAPAPVYAPPFAQGLIRRRLAERGEGSPVELRRIGPDVQVEIGDVRLEFLRVTHSLPDCLSVAMHTPAGTLLHTGDWKIDREPVDGEHFDEEGFARLGRQGVLLMMSDSTNAEIPGWTRSEAEVGRALEGIIAEERERVIVSIFSSNVHRVHLLAEIAQRTGRRLCLVGRSLHRYLEVAAECGRCKLDRDSLVDPRRLEHLTGGEVLVVCTGSQAEPRSALSRASRGEHTHLRVRTGDVVIHSARFIPGNERNIFEMLGQLSRRGARVIHSKAAPVHASGHAYRDELAHLMGLVRPRLFIPLHGEYSFLRQQAEMARQAGVEQAMVVENGETIEVSAEGLARLRDRSLDTYFLDGDIVAAESELEVDDRLRASRDGVVALKVAVLRGGASLQAEVQATTLGLYREGNASAARCARAVTEGLEALPGFTPLADAREAAEVLARRFYRRAIGKRPSVMLFMDELRATR